MAKSLDELAESGVTMPGCAGILETLAAARVNWPHRKGQYVTLSRVMPGSRIGCMILEDSDRGAVL